MSDNNYKDYDLSLFEDPNDEDINKNISSHSQSDYGDDFYTDRDSFEVQSETQVFDPVKERQTQKTPESYDETSQLKKKNYIIIALCISLALVVFIFSLIFFLNSGDDKPDKKNPTVSTKATETVEPTEATEELTQAPTQAPTELPTDAPTQMPTEAPTQTPTLPPTEAQTQEVITESENIEAPTTDLVVE